MKTRLLILILLFSSLLRGQPDYFDKPYVEYNCYIWNKTHSMPFAGTWLRIRIIPYKDLKIGMVVRRVNFFYDSKNPNKYPFALIHRLTGKDLRNCWFTKGDNNQNVDYGVMNDRTYLGIVVGINVDEKNPEGIVTKDLVLN